MVEAAPENAALYHCLNNVSHSDMVLVDIDLPPLQIYVASSLLRATNSN